MTDPLADLLKPSGPELHREFIEAVAQALAARGLTAEAIGSIDKVRFANGMWFCILGTLTRTWEPFDPEFTYGCECACHDWSLS